MEEAKRLVLDGVDVSKEVKAMIGSININDPKSNYYRIFKQLLLIEEHIAAKALNCRFCCFKHSSTAQGLLDEATQLDGRCLYISMNTYLRETLDKLPWRFTTNEGKGPSDEEYATILKDVRALRKYMMELYFFPKSVRAYTQPKDGSTNLPGTPTVYDYSSVSHYSQFPLVYHQY